MVDIEKFLCSELSSKLSSDKNMADNLITICNSFYEKPVHSFGELKLRNTKVKGDIFEEFTKKYLIDLLTSFSENTLFIISSKVLSSPTLKFKLSYISFFNFNKFDFI